MKTGTQQTVNIVLKKIADVFPANSSLVDSLDIEHIWQVLADVYEFGCSSMRL